MISKHRCCEILTKDTELVDCMVECVVLGLRTALEISNPMRPPHDFGTQAFGYITEGLSRRLQALGFERKDTLDGQIRVHVPVERYGFPVRIVWCRGRLKGDTSFRVSKKGRCTRGLVRDNMCCAPQYQFPELKETCGDDTMHRPHTVWLLWQPRRGVDHVDVYLALAVGISPSGQVLGCADVALLYSGPISGVLSGDLWLPEGPTITPVVEEVELAAEPSGGPDMRVIVLDDQI